MGKVYDDWERLVEAVLRREKLRQLCLQHSRTPSDVSSSSCSTCQLDDDSGLALALLLQASPCRSAPSSFRMDMVRLREELIHFFETQTKQYFEQKNCSFFVTCEEDFNDDASLWVNCSTDKTEEYVLEWLHPDLICRMKSIADVMFASHHEQEFCQALIGFSIAAFTEYLTVLGVEELEVEDARKMKWECLNSRVGNWRSAIKNFIGHYLASAKSVFDQLLGEYGQINLTCFVDSSQASVMRLLNFGHAIAIGQLHKPERIFMLLDVYEDIAQLITDVDALFPEDIGSFIRIEFDDLLTQLGYSTKVAFKEFGNYIGSCFTRAGPYADGRIHPLTKRIMKYILGFGTNDDTLNLLLEEEGEVTLIGGPNLDVGQNLTRPLASQLQSLTSVLEAKLDEMSDLFKDSSLKHIFMMNNIHYMVQKVRNSEICPYFGDDWIRSRDGKVRHHAWSYQRVTWSCAVNLLKVGLIERKKAKAICRAFTAAFEDIYMRQTRLCVPDIQLREDLRLLASQTVIHSYRCFVRRVGCCIDVKHIKIKYTADDLENYILDLLEGSSKVLKHSPKRWIRFTLTHSI